MSWSSKLLLPLRYLINDIDGVRYTDERLTQYLVLAALQISKEISFPTTYVVNVVSGAITPDPSADADFENLVLLKAGCIIGRSELSAKSRNGNVTVKLGPSSISSSFSRSEIDNVEKGTCAAYKQAKLEYNASSTQNKNAIINPASSPYFDSGQY